MTSWIQLGITGLSFIIAITLNFAYFRYKVEELAKESFEHKETTQDLAKKVEDAIKEQSRLLGDTATLLKVTVAEQAILNRMTTGLLNSLNDKVESHSKAINELSQIVSLLRELREIRDDKERQK